MTLGNKIRKYRQLIGLTQKELGLMAGFSEATADSRIRKYESDAMAPKTAIRQKLADALDVDLPALSDLDISSHEDVMQALFQLEER
jgi:transcriptional regulator with XRE-family HTH domain